MGNGENMAVFAQNAFETSARGMNLEATLFCGQSFSWQHDSGSYIGMVEDMAVKLSQEGDILRIQNISGQPLTAQQKEYWLRYFTLDIDYNALHNAFAQNKQLAACVGYEPGIRMLRQPFFETLICFIISQNNNIPRINGIVQRLREGFGTNVAEGVYAFPQARQLAQLEVEQLQPLRAGFRAKYILDAARRVADGRLQHSQLTQLPTEEARKQLLEIYGVGQKVADCVLLFGLQRWEVSPMDVWMRRAMQQLFEQGMPECAKGYEGVAQQYIFHYARTEKLVEG